MESEANDISLDISSEADSEPAQQPAVQTSGDRTHSTTTTTTTATTAVAMPEKDAKQALQQAHKDQARPGVAQTTQENAKGDGKQQSSRDAFDDWDNDV